MMGILRVSSFSMSSVRRPTTPARRACNLDGQHHDQLLLLLTGFAAEAVMLDIAPELHVLAPGRACVPVGGNALRVGQPLPQGGAAVPAPARQLAGAPARPHHGVLPGVEAQLVAQVVREGAGGAGGGGGSRDRRGRAVQRARGRPVQCPAQSNHESSASAQSVDRTA